MPSVEVRISSRRVSREFRPETIVSRMATEIRAMNQVITPIRSGRLRRSLRIVQHRSSLIVRWLAPYASYVNRRGRSAGFVDRLIDRAVERVRRNARNDL